MAGIIKNEMESSARVRDIRLSNRSMRLLEDLQRFEPFCRSKPQWDFDFVKILIVTYGEPKLRSELNKMRAWLLADPSRQKKNYRKFVVNWMNRHDKPLIYPATGNNDE